MNKVDFSDRSTGFIYEIKPDLTRYYNGDPVYKFRLPTTATTTISISLYVVIVLLIAIQIMLLKIYKVLKLKNTSPAPNQPQPPQNTQTQTNTTTNDKINMICPSCHTATPMLKSYKGIIYCPSCQQKINIV